MSASRATQNPELTGNAEVVRDNPASLALRFSGHWTQCATLQTADQLISELARHPRINNLVLHADNLQQWDSRLPTVLLKISDYCQEQGITVDVNQLPQGVRDLLALARTVPANQSARPGSRPQPFVRRVGIQVLSGLAACRAFTEFVGEMMLACYTLLRGKARFRPVDLFISIQDAGPSALAIVTLISLLVGLILAFVGAVQLAMFGAQVFIADLVGLGTVREMGALMTAVIMTGRTGAAYAAQLGTMNVNSEIDALKTMGIAPMEFLVLPRLLALVLMMPLLCLYADLIGILGGALVTVSAFDVSLVQYLNETQRAVHLNDFGIGLFKSVVFAVLIATAGCMRGMQCGRSASAVGKATTSAVVDSIVYIVVADSVITLLCNQLGI